MTTKRKAGLLLAAAVFSAGCDMNSVVEIKTRRDGNGLPRGVDRFHDDAKKVTCWEGRRYDIFCIPDRLLEAQ